MKTTLKQAIEYVFVETIENNISVEQLAELFDTTDFLYCYTTAHIVEADEAAALLINHLNDEIEIFWTKVGMIFENKFILNDKMYSFDTINELYSFNY